MSSQAENVAAAAARTATADVPEVIVRAGRVRGYRLSEALVDSVWGLFALITRPFRGSRTNAAGG